jgi:hypothetical protein
MNRGSARSQLHLQMGQEVIYVLMALGLMAALVLVFTIYPERSCSASNAVNDPKCTPSPTKSALPEKPPILNLTESGGFYFDSGSIKLRSDFDSKLRQQVVPEIVRLSSLYMRPSLR